VPSVLTDGGPLILGRLRGVQRAGGGWLAFCPAHDDREKRSLSVSLAKDGKTLLHCFAQRCTVEKIGRAVGMSLQDLAGSNGRRPAPRESVTYSYCDERGRALYQVVRFEPKDFRPRRPDGRGGWIWGLGDVRRVVYRLDELAEQQRVFLVEGEKDADRLWQAGMPATTTAGGAAGWRDDYAEQIKAAGVEEVVICPDNDDAGNGYARRAGTSLCRLGTFVRLLELPELASKGDVSDWLDAGHTRDELEQLATAAPAFDAAKRRPVIANGSVGLEFTPLGDLLVEPEEEHSWLVEGRLPSSGLSLLAGKPKAGKSTLARCLALAVVRGEPWLGFATTQGSVLYLALEEKRAEVRRHFVAMGATVDDPIAVLFAGVPEDALTRLLAEAERRRPALIIVDPLFRLIRVPDGNDYAAVTAALAPLLMLGRETGAHVLAVHHMKKGVGGEDGDGILGSTAIFSTVDTALILKRTERYRTLSSIQRYGDDLAEVTLELDRESRGIAVGPPRAEADEAQAARLIMEFIAGQPQPLEEIAIHDNVEGRKGVKVKALRALVDKGQVSRTGGGRRGNPFLYAVSSSLVPSISGEPENQHPAWSERAGTTDPNSEPPKTRDGLEDTTGRCD
jgi:5S rRNA maturation endonuclease (ribonuclease M5)